MRVIIIIFVVVFNFITTSKVSAMECFTCESQKGNCKSVKTDCDDGQETCQKKTSGFEIVKKKCTTYQECLAEQKDCKNTSCSVYCCTEPYCNEATLVSAPHWFFYTLALSSFCCFSVYFQNFILIR